MQAQTSRGSREKKWVVRPPQVLGGESEMFLFKESHKRHPTEFWSEIVAHRVGKLIGVEILNATKVLNKKALAQVKTS